MTVSVLEHRRARAFADAVDDDRPGAEPTGAAEQQQQQQEYGALLALVDALGRVDGPTLDAEVKLTQRAQLVAAFERGTAEGPGALLPAQRRRGAHRAGRAMGALRPGTRWGRRLVAGGLAAGVTLGTLGGVAMAATNALPGDSLYGMKRGMEDLRLHLAGSESERGRLLLDQAATRMGEAQRLMDRPDHGGQLSPQTVAEVQRALDDMNLEGRKGADLLGEIYRRSHSLTPLRQLASFADEQGEALDRMQPQLPGRLDPIASQVHQLLSGISEEVAPLLPKQSTGGRHAAPQGTATTSGTGIAPGLTATGSPSASAPQGATTSGTGSTADTGSGTASAAPAGPTTSGGGVLSSVTGVLGGGASPAAGTGQPAQGSGTSGSGADAAPSPTPSTGDDGGLSLPPLVPGLLPGLGLGVSNAG